MPCAIYPAAQSPIQRQVILQRQVIRAKAMNLFMAAACGVTLSVISWRIARPSAAGTLIGVLAGLIYANGFEYFLHRFLLHGTGDRFSRQHMRHHASLRSPDAADYVLFTRHPWGVAALLLVHAAPLLLLQRVTGNGWTAGALAALALYYMAFEEIHWRTHMGGRLPRWLAPAARHHLRHHAGNHGQFNVFFPLFDWILANRPAPIAAPARPRERELETR